MRPESQSQSSRLGASSSSISGRRRNGGGGSSLGHSSLSNETEDPLAEASSEALRREIATIENERQRLVESFLALEESTRAKRQPSVEEYPPSSSSAVSSSSSTPKRPLSVSSSLRKSSSKSERGGGDRNFGASVSRALLPTVEVRPPSVVDEDDQEIIKELETLQNKRLAVEARYEGRLDYLRAKLQGALIRERLPR
jgi:hypothetical protein